MKETKLACQAILLAIETVRADMDAHYVALQPHDFVKYAEALKILAEAFRTIKES